MECIPKDILRIIILLTNNYHTIFACIKPTCRLFRAIVSLADFLKTALNLDPRAEVQTLLGLGNNAHSYLLAYDRFKKMDLHPLLRTFDEESLKDHTYSKFGAVFSDIVNYEPYYPFLEEILSRVVHKIKDPLLICINTNPRQLILLIKAVLFLIFPKNTMIHHNSIVYREDSLCEKQKSLAYIPLGTCREQYLVACTTNAECEKPHDKRFYATLYQTLSIKNPYDRVILDGYLIGRGDVTRDLYNVIKEKAIIIRQDHRTHMEESPGMYRTKTMTWCSGFFMGYSMDPLEIRDL